MVVYITGASGYLGKHLVDFFAEKNDTVVALCRKNIFSHKNVIFSNYSLGDGIDRSLPNPDVCIHCAYDFTVIKESSIKRVNVDGSIRLFKDLKELGCKTTIFISTISAFEGCKSIYGKTKLLIEEEGSSYNIITVRPGLIFGGENRGLIGKLSGVVDKLTVLPLIGNGSYPQYLCDINELSNSLNKIAIEELERPSKSITLSSLKSISFKDLLRQLSNKNLKFVSIPWKLIWVALFLGEKVTNKLPFRSDSVTSLVSQNPNVDFSYIKENNIEFKELPN